MISNKWHLRYNAPVFACLAIILMLLAVPTGFEGNLVFQTPDLLLRICVIVTVNGS